MVARLARPNEPALPQNAQVAMSGQIRLTARVLDLRPRLATEKKTHQKK